MIPVGDGLPAWLDTERFLSADETRRVGPAIAFDHAEMHTGRCLLCRVALACDRAHVARKQMGGRREAGPMVPLCRTCHNALDQTDDWCVAVLRWEGAPPYAEVRRVDKDGAERHVGYVGLGGREDETCRASTNA